MKLTEELYVRFHHNRAQDGTPIGTTCSLSVLNSEGFQEIGSTQSLLGKNEQFNRKVGRKKAFGKLIQETTPDRMIREELWSNYFNIFPIN